MTRDEIDELYNDLGDILHEMLNFMFDKIDIEIKEHLKHIPIDEYKE